MNQIINTLKLPKHIAITMDGNGRWAKEKGKIDYLAIIMALKLFETPLKEL